MNPSTNDFKIDTYTAMSEIIHMQQNMIDELYALLCRYTDMAEEHDITWKLYNIIQKRAEIGGG